MLRFWIAAILLLIVAALGLATLPRVIDWNSYRTDIEVVAAELSGHAVTINGPIAISLLPRPVLTAQDVAVRGVSNETVGFDLTTSQMDIALEIGPLLAGRPVIRDLDLRRPVLRLKDEDDGRQLLAWPPRWQDWAAPFLRMQPNRIGIADGRIELAGDGQDTDIALNDMALQLSMGHPDGPLEAAGLFRIERHGFTLEAAFGRPDGNGVSSANVLIQARNGADETSQARFSGSVQLEEDDPALLGRLTLSGPDLKHGLAALSSATGYPSTFHSLAAGQPFDIRGRIEADRVGIRAEDIQLAIADKSGDGELDLAFHPQRRLDLTLDLPTIRLADIATLSDFLPLDLLSKLDVPPGDIDLRLRELVYREQSVRRAAVRLSTGVDRETVVERASAQLPGLVDLQFEGRAFPSDIGPKLTGKLVAVGDNLGSSLVWLGLIDASARGDGWRRFSFESDVEVSSVEIALSTIDMRLDSSKVQGRASLRFRDRTALIVDADIERLNADLYAAAWRGEDGLEQLVERVLDLDATVIARFEQLTAREVLIEEALISAGLRDRELSLQSVTAKTVGETALDVGGTIDLAEETATLDARLTGKHLIRALRHLGVDLPLGSARIQPVDITGRIDGRLERFDLTLDARYDGGEASIEGEAGWRDDEPRYDVMIEARHPDHLRLAGQFGLAPLLPVGDADGPFEVTGTLRSVDDDPFAASGSAKLGPSTFTGSLAFREEAATGPWELKLSVGRPQWDSLSPILNLAGLRQTGNLAPDRWLGRLPAIGLRTAWLDDFEGSVSIASKGGLVGDGLQLSARLIDGLFYVNRLEASPWQGKLQAELTLERRRDQPFMAVVVDLDQVQTEGLADWLGVESVIDAPLDIRLEASTVGVTPFDMVAGLSGEMTLSAGPGDLRGLDIPALRRLLLNDASDDRAIDRSLSQGFDAIEAKADLGRGILTLADGTMRTEGPASGAADIAIEGTVDLLLWVADLTLKAERAMSGTGDGSGPQEPARVYRVVGRPDRLDGFIAAGN